MTNRPDPQVTSLYVWEVHALHKKAKAAGNGLSLVSRRFVIAPGGAYRRAGFSMVELLAVLAIIALLGVLAGPMISSILGSHRIEQASSELAGTLEGARAYAMAHSTYVRVGFSTLSSSATGSAQGVLVYGIYSATGELDADSADMTNSQIWRPIAQPLVLNNLAFSSALVDETDTITKNTDLPAATFPRVGIYKSVKFDLGWIQFGPSGTARVVTSTAGAPPLYIQFPFDQSNLSGKNPFVVVCQGLSGAVQILRKENLN